MEDINKLNAELKSLLAMGEDELFELLAEEVLPPSMGLFSAKNAIQGARKWFEEHKESFRERVCSSVALRLNLNDPECYETVTTVASVLDLIAGFAGSIPINVVAVLIVKQGYPRFCSGYEQHPL